jgi:hypothetical protein
MQSDDVKRMLEAAAAGPSRPLDTHALLTEGARLRRARLGAAAAGLAVVVAGASASLGMLGGNRDGAPGPANTVAGRCGEEVRPARRLEVVARDLALKAEVKALARDLQRRQAERESNRAGERKARRATAASEAALRRLRRLSSKAAAEVREIETFAEGLCAADETPADGTTVPAPRIKVGFSRFECNVSALYADTAPEGKWCRFVIRVVNEGESPAVLRAADQVLQTQGRPVSPWPEAMEADFPSRIFTRPIAPEDEALGEVVFLLSKSQVPVALEIHAEGGDHPVRIGLDYDCPPDLHDVPSGRCLFGSELKR